MLKAALEAGGTRVTAAVGLPGEPPRRLVRLATASPDETLGEAIAFFEAARRAGLAFDALGIASFGPLDLDPGSPTWGRVTATPKPGWAGADVAGRLGRALGVPAAIDTDVNAAALAEHRLGAGRGADPLVYFTVGTGIGGGAVVEGRLLHGRVHPEMGHALLARHPADPYPGGCPFHGACAEGLASGPALAARWGRRAEDLPPDHPAWAIEAYYLAQLALTAQLFLSPRLIVLGGGVMAAPGLLERVRAAACELAAGYLARPRTAADWADAIQAPALQDPGLQGAFLLACSARL